MTYASVLCPSVEHRTGCNHTKEPGCHVMIGNNRGPTYEVIAVSGETAWLKHDDSHQDAFAPVCNCRVVPCKECE